MKPHEAEYLAYVIETDGDKWFARYENFTSELAVGDTPQLALQNFIDGRRQAVMPVEEVASGRN